VLPGSHKLIPPAHPLNLRPWLRHSKPIIPASAANTGGFLQVAVSKARRPEYLLFRNFVQSARFRYSTKTFHSQPILCAQHPLGSLRPLGKFRSAAGTTSRTVQHGDVLPQTALLGTVPPLELSRIVPNSLIRGQMYDRSVRRECRAGRAERSRLVLGLRSVLQGSLYRAGTVSKEYLASPSLLAY
jgi:hypothetical protein